MVKDWEKQYPSRTEIMMNAIHNISPSHLFDKELFNFDKI